MPFLALLALLAGCTSAPEVRPQGAPTGLGPEVYFPLKVGNSWTYETRFGKKVEQNTVKIEKQEGGYFRDNQRGVLAFDPTGLRDERRYLIQAPVTPGTRWKSVVDIGKTETYEIVSTEEVVTVPAGTFHDALLVRGHSQVDAATEIEIEWLYAPNVGLVKMVTTAVIGGRERVPQTEIALRSYDVK